MLPKQRASTACLPPTHLPAVDPDCSHQRRLSQLTRHHKLLSRLAGGVGALPFGLRRALVRLVAPQLEPHAVDTTVKGTQADVCSVLGPNLSRPGYGWLEFRLDMTSLLAQPTCAAEIGLAF